MPDIRQIFFVKARPEKVFERVSTPEGIDSWWSHDCTGKPAVGEKYHLGFAPEYQWNAVVSKCTPSREFELTMKVKDADWENTRVGFNIQPQENGSKVEFYHLGWPADNEHLRIATYCWAMYLRILKLNVENGYTVPYDDRLDV
jgi:uncharacterized protein YndB with AHSA1/START domain